MNDFSDAIVAAIGLIVSLDSDLTEIVALSLGVSLTATVFAGIIGMPLGAAVALFRFPGRTFVSVLLNAFMGLPPVVAGLVVYLILSRSGPLGILGLLFSQTAMVVAQVLLITPIVAALTRQIIADLWSEYDEQLRSLGAGPARALPTLLWDGRFSLLTAVLAGFGRASAEVGAVMIVGGNIAHVTRTMTTAIALEVSKGALDLALGLGIILITLAILINAAAHGLSGLAKRWEAAAT